MMLSLSDIFSPRFFRRGSSSVSTASFPKFPLIVVAILLGTPVCSTAFPQLREIGPGAIISVRGPTNYVSVLSSDVSVLATVPNLKVDRLSQQIFHVTFKRPDHVTSQSSLRPPPAPYSRKNNPCKRAKARRLMASIRVRARCEPNWAYRATLTPNDPDYSQQYASSFLSLPAAWDKTTGNSDLVAVVIDTGIQLNHPDLSANIWSNPGEIAGNGIDDDANGYIDDVNGINAITGLGDPNDDNGHGTHCAGILGAKGNNSTGIAGVSWNAKIAAAKFLDASGSGYTSDAIESIYYTMALKQAGNNVVVTNNSWGGGGYSAALYIAIHQATAAGILFVAAAGNDTLNTDVYPSYPASYNLDGIISVASSNSSGNLSYFSNFGTTSVDIAAPGSLIRSCVPTNSYASYSGTSMAAPQVTGIALLAQSICSGTLTVAQLKAAILNSGVAYSSLNGQIATGAIANADGAITAANISCNGAPTATPTNTPENTPTDTPTPPESTSTPEPEPPTPDPAPGTGPDAKMAVTINPGDNLAPKDSISITINNGGASRQASLQLLARDSSKRSYSCPAVTVTLNDEAASLTFVAPSAIRQFSSITALASSNRKSARDSSSILNPLRNRSLTAGQKAFKTLCNLVRRSAK